jgi:hypothetical protein
MTAEAPTPEELIGRTGEPYEFVVEKGKIVEFARATKTENPEYLRGETPLSEPTFLMASAHWSHEKANALYGVPMDLKNVLHGEQEFVFHGEPPRAGAKLTAQMRVENVFTKAGKRGGDMKFTVTVVEFRDPAGKVVAESRSTRIETGKTPPKES